MAPKELLSQKPQQGTRWLVTGDFNQVYLAREMNRTNVDRSRLVRFQNTLNSCELKEIHLQNRRFTWSNEQATPTLVRRDRACCNMAWELLFPAAERIPQSSAISDHCPLLVDLHADFQYGKRFKF